MARLVGAAPAGGGRWRHSLSRGRGAVGSPAGRPPAPAGGVTDEGRGRRPLGPRRPPPAPGAPRRLRRGAWRPAARPSPAPPRLALAFDNDSKRGLRIDFVAERLEELETLAARQRPINGPLLKELDSSTQRAVSGIDPGPAPPED